MKKKNKLSSFILLLMFFIGLSVMLYPSVSNYWNMRTQSQAIVDYKNMLESIPEKDYSEIFEKADGYNKAIASLPYPLIEYGSVSGYTDALNTDGTGMIGYLTIDAIGLELPVYHTTDDDVLSHAVGHLEGTSLPTGGIGTHAVISAHRGLPTATLFTNLDHLEIGDTFKLNVLDRELLYRIDSIKTVKPSDTSDLLIDSNEDRCTLLTCTPYGINTHRLLVRGTRVGKAERPTVYVTTDAHQIKPIIVTPIVALPILLVLMLIVLFKPIKYDELGE